MCKSGSSKIKQSAIVVMVVILISKLMGLLRDVVLAKYYGTSNISDAYLITASVPTLLFYFIGHSLSTAFLPIYNKVKAEKDEKQALKYTNNLLCCSLLLCFILVAILLIFPQAVVKVFAAGFDKETTDIAARMIRICSPSLFFFAIINVWSGYLHSKNNFVLPAMISLPRNLAVIASIVYSASFGIDGLAIGLIIAYFLEFIFLLPSVFKSGYRPKLYVNVKDEEMKDTLAMVVPILIGVAVSQINKIIDKSIASTLMVGGISALSYASIIETAIQEVLVTSIITILFAKCSELVAQQKHDEVKNKLSHTINVLQALLIPACVGIFILAEPIVSIILMRGNFDKNSLSITVGALKFYTIGLVFIAIRDVLVKVFYAYKQTKITTVISIGSILLNILLNIILSRFLGINGLALATSISMIFNAIVLYVVLSKKLGNFGTNKMLINILKVVVCTTAMGILVSFSYNVWFNYLADVIKLIISVLIGATSYFILAIILRVFKLKKKVKE